MDTIVVTVPRAVSAASFRSFVAALGGASVEGIRSISWTLERGTAAVYMDLEDAPTEGCVPFSAVPGTRVLLTVGRAEGSLQLAFELAKRVTDTWGGRVWCSGVPGWQEAYLAWLATQPL
jgi:hypothetical protein